MHMLYGNPNGTFVLKIRRLDSAAPTVGLARSATAESARHVVKGHAYCRNHSHGFGTCGIPRTSLITRRARRELLQATRGRLANSPVWSATVRRRRRRRNNFDALCKAAAEKAETERNAEAARKAAAEQAARKAEEKATAEANKKAKQDGVAVVLA